MKYTKLYLISLISSFGLILLGTISKIMHLYTGPDILSTGMACSLIYIVLGLKDVFRDRRTKVSEKLMWLTGFLFLNFLVGVVYYPRLKKNVPPIL